MRLLHTSDWHLGRSFHREDLLGAQARFVDFLVGVVRAEAVDAVLVSGDVYDRALPPVDAVALANDALRRLVATGARVVLISGNHDSATRLGFGADLLDAGGLHLRTDPARCGAAVLVPHRAGTEDPVAVYGLPYLEPEAVRGTLGCDRTGHRAVLGAAMDRVRAAVARSPGTRSVALAHAFVTGGEPSESERDITVGGAAAVPTATFDGVDYVALGHLHGPQALTDRVRYSGSPLAYSFSEADHRKAVLLVDLAPDGRVRTEALATPVPRALSRVRGRLEDLLGDPRLAAVEGSYLQVTLTDPVRPRDPMARLQQRFPHTLVLAFEPEGAGHDDSTSYAARVRGRSDLDLAADFVGHVRGEPPQPAERSLLADAFEHVRRDEAALR